MKDKPSPELVTRIAPPPPVMSAARAACKGTALPSVTHGD
jgi:hypothetical protein